ncbi:MAG: ABC transporter ATP-binding protein [Defluviitaleaceae bacterium]|nr:ABC transporter ATP-binding protein [Defluviitaleaceae bacterium]
MDNILSVTELTKSYGRKKVLQGTTFTLPVGRLVGLMGPNASGKTTMFNIISGLTKFRRGSVTIDGVPVGVATRSLVSYMPDKNFLYKYMTAKDALGFYKDFFPDFNEKTADELCVSLGIEKDEKVKKMSKGTVEKLLLLLTLSRKTKLYLLDEPLGGIDPLAKTKIVDTILGQFTGKDSTMVLSTHLLRDTEKLFDYALYLKDGQIIKSGEADTLRQENNKTLEEIYVEVYSE